MLTPFADPGSQRRPYDTSGYYAITIKNNLNSRVAYKKDLLHILNSSKLRQVGQIFNIRFEVDSKSKLHLHCGIISTKKIRYKNHQVKGWNIYMRKMYNPKGWINYINKTGGSPYQQELLLLIHYYRHNYCFI